MIILIANLVYLYYYSGRSGDDGRDGLDGEFKFVIENNEYRWRYDLSIDSCIIQPQKGNDIIEPGCFINILPTYINSGGCPTPSHQVNIKYFNYTWEY